MTTSAHEGQLQTARARDPLARIAEARAWLEASKNLEEIRGIHDLAVAAKEYARARQLGGEAQRYAQEIVNRAERRLGQVLAETPSRQGERSDKLPSPGEVSSRQQAGWKLSARSQQIASLDDDTFEANVSKPVTRLARIARDRQAEQRRREQPPPPPELRCDIRCGDFREVLADITADAVITDPPYPREFLPLLGDLAKWADSILTEDGVLAVLLGESWLPQAYSLLEGGRPYRWTMAYLTPGHGYASQNRRVQSHWKPVLVYGKGQSFDDVIRCEEPSGFAHHPWEQSVSGFRQLVERLTIPGHVVADPFMGSGTTLVAALEAGRHAIGCDSDAAHVGTAHARVQR